MLGNGKNKKSMAYIGNIAAFLNACLFSEQRYGVYNYVDTPDMDMNELVSLVRKTLQGKQGVGLRLPYWLGLVLGYIADGVARFTGSSLPVSSIRVRKFCATTQFNSQKDPLDGFEAPYSLAEGIEHTLHSEFISPDPNREIFFTE